jgi:hypothetical protein
MIERNLGNIERVVRLVLGLSFGGWALMQPYLNGVEWFVILVSVSLILNGIFSRCYLWFLLDLDTSENSRSRAPEGASCHNTL